MSKIRMDELLRFIPKVKNLVHVGANEGQEVPIYLAAGIAHIHLVEPIPEIYDKLIKKFRNHAEITISQCLCLDTFGKTEFFTTTKNGLSSSIYSKHDPKMHKIEYNPGSIFVNTVTLDSLTEMYDTIDLLVIDAQGSEDKVLRGAKETLKKTERVFTEVSETPLYENACVLNDIDDIMSNSGFVRVGLYLNERGTGDALYWKE
jgi:FkbM family methyltransferase